MTTADKKREIIKELASTNDEQLIEEVFQLLHPIEGVESVDISTIPEELQTKIYRALDDYKNGRYISHEQMKEKVEGWLTS